VKSFQPGRVIHIVLVARSCLSGRLTDIFNLPLLVPGIIGLLQSDPEDYLKSAVAGSSGLPDDAVETLIQQRLDARNNKDWAAADRLRDELTAAGIAIEDSAGGTRWRRT